MCIFETFNLAISVNKVLGCTRRYNGFCQKSKVFYTLALRFPEFDLTELIDV